MNLNIYLVNQPQDIVEVWGLVKEGFTKVMDKGHGEETLDFILSQLINSQLFLWVIFDKETDEYIGFFTTKKVFNFYKGDNVGCLIVNHYYKKNRNWNKEGNKEVNEFITRHAMETGCKFIKMYTARDKDRYWNDLGFFRAYTEYVKEVVED